MLLHAVGSYYYIFTMQGTINIKFHLVSVALFETLLLTLGHSTGVVC